MANQSSDDSDAAVSGTSADASSSSAAASLMHQTNRDGKQQTILSPTITPIHKPLLSELFFKYCCCFSDADLKNKNITGGILNKKLSKELILPTIIQDDANKMCLVLDLDETLVHSSFKPVPNPDYVLPIEIEGQVHHIYVLKRPGVDEFLEQVGKIFEVVIFTASLSKYADPLLDLLDIHKVIRHRLFRESCTLHEGAYVKDLTRLGRDLKKTIIVDNSPASFAFQPENAIGISTYIDDPADRELFYCLDFLRMIHDKDSVFDHLLQYSSHIEKLAEEYNKSTQ